jgi:chromosome segregation ATPase
LFLVLLPSQASLSQSYSISESELQKLERLVSELEQSNVRLRAHLEESSKATSELRMLYRQARERAERLRRKLEELSTTLESLKESLKGARIHSTNSEQALSLLRAKLNEAEKSLEDFLKLSKQLERKLVMWKIAALAGPPLTAILILILVL